MPLVLTQNEVTASGHVYADVLGRSYEFPSRYRRRVLAGERFVYYQGRRRADGASAQQVYLGVGVIGRIDPADDAGRLVCMIEDFVAFATPVSFKDAQGRYLERGAGERNGGPGLYFQVGVRAVDDETFERVFSAASTDTERGGALSGASSYPASETARAVDTVAMKIAEVYLAEQFPRHQVHRMAQNNPGYDFEVRGSSGVVERYIEVKGTIRRGPEFFMSEGERLFSLAHEDMYTLVVVHAIDLVAATGTPMRSDGAVAGPVAELRARQWTGRLTSL